MLFGYLDFMRKCGEFTQVDNKYICVIYSTYIFPKDIHYFVPLDQDFLEGRSPYQEGEHIIASDYQNWHPQVRFQAQTLNMIGSTGPATIKLPPQVSAEAHMRYIFHFKLGGQPPPMATLTDPDLQPKYTTPDNILQTPSLQSPTSPFEYILYNFDERRGQLTKAAAKRITKHEKTEKTIFPITETAFACPIASTKEIQTSDSSDEEKEEMSLQEQLKLQRKQQKLLRLRINQLLQHLTKLE